MPILFALTLFAGLHFMVPLPLTNQMFVPNVALVLAAAIMALRQPNWQLVILVGVASSLFVSLAILANFSSAASIAQQLLSGGQLVYSAVIAATIASAAPFREEAARRAAAWCLGIAFGVVVLGLLETKTFLAAVSDAFRARVYETGLYYADERDITMAGFVRPKVFAAEPSHAAWSVSALALCALAYDQNRKVALCAILICGFGAMVFYSPAALATCGILVVVSSFLKERRSPHGLLSKTLIVVGGALLVLTLFPYILGVRLETDEVHGVEGSVFIRIVQPFTLAYEALIYNPFIGVGFRGLEAIWTKIPYIEEGIGSDDLNMVPGMAILTIPLFTGIYGVIVFGVVLMILLRQLPYGRRIAFAIVVLFALTQKQSFVLSSAWLIGAVWFLQSKPQPVPAGVEVVKAPNDYS